ncbi:hypothetical protein EUGRSUZ_L01569 [Eucalyptus grandis]|uniref:Xaa-Pro dipeptidyl-peptidase-like domain-containing protein n=1 Tax=Eucalyptus grandis TaxID=71139 RepID=A0A058ZTV4_EUCGR|nr:hypothetical protein EUGRSUZ_L01569 [Eucalyptus grandis]
MSNYTVESCKVESADRVVLHTRLFKPREDAGRADDGGRGLGVVLVHPYTVLGGCQALLRGIASELAGRGLPAVTFDMRGAGKSTGRPSLTGFAEVKDVIAVCKWACDNLSLRRILLVGSSADGLVEHFVLQIYRMGLCVSLLCLLDRYVNRL